MSAGLRVDTALYAIAVLLDRLLAFLMLPFLTRALTPQDYGSWTQTAVTAGLIAPLVLLAFPTAIVRYFSSSRGGAHRRPFFHRLGAVSLALFAAIGVASLAGASTLAAWVYGDAAAGALVPALVLLVAADAGMEFAVAWLRAAGPMAPVTGLLMLRSLLRYGALLVVVERGGGTLAQWLTAYAATLCAFTLPVLWATRRRLAPASAAEAAAPPTTLAELLRFAAPLVLLSGVTALNGVLDRYVMVRLTGLESVAVYAAAMSLVGLAAIVHGVLGFTLFPVLARRWGEGGVDETAALLVRALQVNLFLGLPVVLATALIGPWGLPLLTTEHYRAGVGLFALLGAAVTAFGVYQILLYALLLDGRTMQVLGVTVFAMAINLTLNLLLTPRHGALGAAAAAAGSSLILALLAGQLARAVLPWRFPWAAAWRIAWRSAVAALPLAWVVAGAEPRGALVLTALGVGLLSYLVLDLADRGAGHSLTRALLR